MDSRLVVGTTVYMKPVGNNARYKKGNIEDHIVEMTIVKVGKKFFYVNEGKGWRDIQMRIDEMRDHSQYSANWIAYFDKQDIIDEHEKSRLFSYLKHGAFGYYNFNLSLDQLRRIVAIVDEGKDVNA